MEETRPIKIIKAEDDEPEDDDYEDDDLPPLENDDAVNIVEDEPQPDPQPEPEQ